MGFSLVLFVYTWSWSTLYPKIEINVFLFIVSTIVVSLILGIIFQKKYLYKDVKVNNYNFAFTALIVLGYIVEFIYNKGIPLFLIFQGDAYSHYDFGIPTFHVFLQTIAPFYTIYLYHQYISSKNKNLIFYLVILFFLSVLVVNRGSTLMTLMSCLVIYCQKKQFISYKAFSALIIALLFVFYMFGFIGFARSFKDHEDYLFEIAEAKDSFRESLIPGEFFWFYLYASSPIANFQNAVNEASQIRYNLLVFTGSELIPDFVTKRIIDPAIDPDKVEGDKYLIAKFLTVGSIYYDPFRRMGWFGVIIIFVWLMVIMAFVPILIKADKPYFSTTIAILCTMALFSTFDNMIRFTGLSFQLVYPFLLGYIGRYYFKTKKIKLIIPRITIKI
ncbi:O-antigen polysaccharide polymerase Wzy [Spirosoma fluviale]|uniref:O-antigen polysaccharide polymerase Wzy n=2 Tax=Spirosoma fluviale TaxID=1597977 RepID=A0A286GHS1_9BACT|nr:O-antigen polysaccharide polymerase Wzy [Spirosoma fluviale]